MNKTAFRNRWKLISGISPKADEREREPQRARERERHEEKEGLKEEWRMVLHFSCMLIWAGGHYLSLVFITAVGFMASNTLPPAFLSSPKLPPLPCYTSPPPTAPIGLPWLPTPTLSFTFHTDCLDFGWFRKAKAC
jgi:hypothetical protein